MLAADFVAAVNDDDAPVTAAMLCYSFMLYVIVWRQCWLQGEQTNIFTDDAWRVQIRLRTEDEEVPDYNLLVVEFYLFMFVSCINHGIMSETKIAFSR